MGKRDMKAVLYLSNNWEWSGGFLQYLNWNGRMPDSILQRPLSWDNYRDYVSRFYTCASCTTAYHEQVKRIVGRINTITGKAYRNDATIMAWQLANEPRPMRPASVEAYVQWVEQTAALIKSIDKNHLVSTGSEGLIGSENAETYERAHRLKNIDYLTIHIWPKNWQWFRDTSISKGSDSLVQKTMDYISANMVYSASLHKPLVIEEFGLPRDRQQFSPGSPAYWRNRYFDQVMSRVVRSAKSGGSLAGCNFWGFAGSGRANATSHWWSEGDDYLADPPMEEQGLNSVFDVDKTTWAVITRHTKQLYRSKSSKPLR
jgi:mannan endo-1,4-beta-mannosidase